MKNIVLIFLSLVLGFVSSGFAGEKQLWTLLVYANYDNENRSWVGYLEQDLSKIKRSAEFQVIAQVDYGDSSARYLVDSSGSFNMIPGTKTGAINSSDPKTLSDFLEWGVKNYPADRTAVSIICPSQYDTTFCEDDSAGGSLSASMAYSALGQAVKMGAQALPGSLKKFDFLNISGPKLGWFSGYLGNIGILNELSDSVQFYLAPPKNMGTANLGISSLIAESIKMNLSKPLKEQVREIISAISPESQNYIAVDLSRVEDLTKKLDGIFAVVNKLMKTSSAFKKCVDARKKLFHRNQRSNIEQMLQEFYDCEASGQSKLSTAVANILTEQGSWADLTEKYDQNVRHLIFSRSKQSRVRTRADGGAWTTTMMLPTTGKSNFKLDLYANGTEFDYVVETNISDFGEPIWFRESTTHISFPPLGSLSTGSEFMRFDYPASSAMVAATYDSMTTTYARGEYSGGITIYKLSDWPKMKFSGMAPSIVEFYQQL